MSHFVRVPIWLAAGFVSMCFSALILAQGGQNFDGRICDEPDVVKYRDMSIVLRDRIRTMIKKGMTLDQVKAGKPLADYDALYYSPAGLGSDDTVTEVMYKDLSQNK